MLQNFWDSNQLKKLIREFGSPSSKGNTYKLCPFSTIYETYFTDPVPGEILHKS